MLSAQFLLHALLKDGDPRHFLNAVVRPEFFKTDEDKKVLAYVSDHVRKHHRFPTVDTVQEDTGVILPVSSEPFAYYLEKCESRYRFAILNETFQAASDSLKLKDTAAVIGTLTGALAKITATASSVRYVDVLNHGPSLVMMGLQSHYTGSLSVGWPHIDDSGGVKPGDIVSIIGRPGAGKTFLTLQIADHIVFEQRKKLLYYSTEMPAGQLLDRAAAIRLRHRMSDIQRGQVSSFAKPKFEAALNSLYEYAGEALYHIVDASSGAVMTDDIAANAAIIKPDAIIVDGAYLIAHRDPKLDRYRKVAENVEALKRLAGELGCPIFGSFQFARSGTKKPKGEKPTLEDIAYSDAIGQVSSLVLALLQAPDAETLLTNPNVRTVDVLKGRDGETGAFEIHWDFLTSNFRQYEALEEVVY